MDTQKVRHRQGESKKKKKKTKCFIYDVDLSARVVPYVGMATIVMSNAWLKRTAIGTFALFLIFNSLFYFLCCHSLQTILDMAERTQAVLYTKPNLFIQATKNYTYA